MAAPSHCISYNFQGLCCPSPLVVPSTQRVGLEYQCYVPPVDVESPSMAYTIPTRTINDYYFLDPIGSETFGTVFQAMERATGKVVAIKRIQHKSDHTGVVSAEIRYLSSASGHSSIIKLEEVFVLAHTTFIVMEYANKDLRSLLHTKSLMFNEESICKAMFGLLNGLAHLHRLEIVHRDIKTPNILVTKEGVVKICDFGLSCSYNSNRPLPPCVVPVGTLPYIAPEMLLGMEYSPAIDMWSVGCVMAELVSKKVLFRGKKGIDQINEVFKTLGKPEEKEWPEFYKFPRVKDMDIKQIQPDIEGLRGKIPQTILSSVGFNLLSRLLAINPRDRITADEAISHPWFWGILIS